MNAPTNTMHRDCCSCESCASAARNNYYPGKRLTADSFKIEQSYQLERRRLINRALHGWGVIYGYGVRATAVEGGPPGVFQIGEGLALDRVGRELIQPASRALSIADVIFLDDSGRQTTWDKLEVDADACWLLKVHYAEQPLGPVSLNDPCSCERSEWDRVCETVRYSLMRIECGDCCAEEGCGLDCACASNACCDEQPVTADQYREQLEREYAGAVRQANGDPAKLAAAKLAYDRKLLTLNQGLLPQTPAKMHGRGGCRCLCDHLTGLAVGVERSVLCKVDECARADLANGVGLACIKLEVDDCKQWRLGAVYDDCGPRRLVKRNDLLFDLIRGCDLTRIVDIGWSDWHRSDTTVGFDDFARALGYDGSSGKPDYPTQDFWVEFSRPVRAETVKPDCFVMTVLAQEVEGGWWNAWRVPITRVEATPQDGDPPHHVRKANIVVDGAWLEDAVAGRRSVFMVGDARVEIEVRGDFIVDCNGQPVDANARGLSPAPTGSGQPGDTFLSTFSVAQRNGQKSKNQHEGAAS
ncbi:MAG TPA: hypothetical protein VG889_05750 [Rhizomicrobium sp.]|nr:hypothetical protein [Rhizomicrobium sp.]